MRVPRRAEGPRQGHAWGTRERVTPVCELGQENRQGGHRGGRWEAATPGLCRSRALTSKVTLRLQVHRLQDGSDARALQDGCEAQGNDAGGMCEEGETTGGPATGTVTG